MPSGSHGGSGGSHGGFSGGSSGGGTHGGSSFGGGSYHARPRGPRPFRFGRTVFIVSTGRQSILSLILFIGVVFLGLLFVNFSTLGDYNDQLSMIEEENKYYLNMVLNATTNPEYMVEGVVEDQFYKSQYERYYITYSFIADDGSEVEGYTFSIYTSENLPTKGAKIWLAVNDSNTDSETDSIPMDYANYTLQDDGEYLLYKAGRAKIIRTLVIAGVVIALLVAGYILVIVTSKKKAEEKEEQEKQEAKDKANAEERKKFCAYCGTRISATDTTCPNCGARLNTHLN